MKNIFLVTIFSLLCFQLMAQENSPYSRYGLGGLQGQDLVNTQSLGGNVTAYQAFDRLNISNPASYASLRLTCFEVGLNSKIFSVTDGNNTIKQGDMRPAYLILGVPITNHWGSTIGLMPYSRVAYSLIQRVSANAINLDSLTYQGIGSTYSFFWGNGFSYKNLSVGINAGYLFGQLRYAQNSYFNSAAYTLNTHAEQQLAPAGFTWNAGLQYKYKLNDKYHLLFGLSGNSQESVRAHKSAFWYRFNDAGLIIDTPVAHLDTIGRINLPMQYNVGVMLVESNKFGLALNYNNTAWGNYSAFGNQDSLRNSWRLSIGAQYTPDVKAVKDYFKTCEYRFGLYYGTDYVFLHNTSTTITGFTAGIGLPLRRASSHVNIGINAGSRGTTQNQLLRENFLHLNVGFTLNDIWFIKRKFD